MSKTIEPISSHPTEAEIAGRLVKVRAKMTEQGLDVYLCCDPANVFYLTNFANYVHERPFILIIPAKGRVTFLMPKLEAPHVRIRSVGDLVLLPYAEFPALPGQQWSDRLPEAIPAGSRVGVETLCPLAVAEALPDRPVPTDIVDGVRMIKSPYEIGRIAYTCGLLSQGQQMLLAGSRPGRMMVELHSAVTRHLTKKLLMDNPNSNMLNTKFAAVAQPPSLSHDPHNFTDVFVKMEEGGPHVFIVNGLANGYGGEVERTFFINRVPKAAVRPFNHMLEARALAFDLVKPGNLMSEVDRRVNQFFIEKGYGDNLLHRTGHSFGVTDHEAPFLAEGYDHKIRANMVFSIEPGIYIPGIGGFRFSDTVLVTETGNQKLTRAPEDLAALTLKRRRHVRDRVKSWMINRSAKEKAA